MTITPPAPIDRSKIGKFRAEVISLLPAENIVVIVVGVYDTAEKRIDERRFRLTQSSAPTVAQYIAACPAAGNLRRQTELFMNQLDAEQAGEVD